MAIKTMTAVGNAQIDTGITDAFGGNAGCGMFDGTGDWVTTPDDTDWQLGVGKFTIDFWFQTTATGYQYICGQVDAGTDFWGITIHGNGSDNINFGSLTGGAWDVNFGCTIGSMASGTWHHIEIARDGITANDWYLFVDGTARTKNLAVGAYDTTIIDCTSVLYVGGNPLNAFGTPFNGYIDELRISKGVVRHISNFTPETSAYTANAGTVLLLHMDGADQSTTFTDDSYVAASGPANLKTYNTNTLANIKSINTNLLANVKSLNSNT